MNLASFRVLEGTSACFIKYPFMFNNQCGRKDNMILCFQGDELSYCAFVYHELSSTALRGGQVVFSAYMYLLCINLFI